MLLTVWELEFLGHIIRKRGIEDLCLSGKIMGERAGGHQCYTYISTISTLKHPTCGDQGETENSGVKQLVKHRIGDGTRSTILYNNIKMF